MYNMNHRYAEGDFNFSQCDQETINFYSDYNHSKITALNILINSQTSSELAVEKSCIPKLCFTGVKPMFFPVTLSSIATFVLPRFNIKAHHASVNDL
jgi:hypothetical protein